MKLAVTDACIFIDLFETGLTWFFFELPYPVHTSEDVLNELFEEQRAGLHLFIESGKLTVHPISSETRNAIVRAKFPKSLSPTDQTVLYLAMELGAMVISSDKVMRNTARHFAIEYHGMLWILDQLIEFRLLKAKEVVLKLEFLLANNLFYRHNRELMTEVEKRLKKWKNG